MLVSSIGYFDAKKNVNNNCNVKNQPPKVNMAEGFGQYDKNRSRTESVSVFTTVKNAIKSIFSKDKSENSSKYTSLIA